MNRFPLTARWPVAGAERRYAVANALVGIAALGQRLLDGVVTLAATVAIAGLLPASAPVGTLEAV